MSPRDARPAPTAEPYVGPRAFREDDGHRFFGRARESHEVADLWQANRLTILHGPSGVGKTSLIRAGVLPLLDRTMTDVLPIGRVSHSVRFPLATLSRHNPHVFALLSSWCPEETPTRLAGQTLRGFLRSRPRRYDLYGDPALTLAAIDQAEELFSALDQRWPYREWFMEQLVEALDGDPNLRLLVSIREDHLPALLPHEPKLAGMTRGRFPLAALGTDAAVQAAEGPLTGTGRSFAPGAARALVTDLCRTGAGEAKEVQPVQLQVVCSAMWRALSADVRIITVEHVSRFADVDRALADFAEQMITEVARDFLDGDADRLRRWLRRTFITEQGQRRDVYQGETSTAGEPNHMVKALVGRHILREEVRAGARLCKLAHDRLVPPILRSDRSAGPVRNEGRPEDYLRAAEIAFRDGELTLAAKQAEEALNRCGDDDWLRAAVESFLGNVAHRREDTEKAVAHYRAAARLFETLGATAEVGRLLAGIGKLRLAQGRPSAAVRELNSAVDRVPDDMAVQTELAWALWYGGHSDAAVDVLDGVLAREGDTVEALRARGEILAERGRGAEALRDLDRVRPLQWPSTRAAYALALASEGHLSEADREMTAVLVEAGDHGPALLYAARISEAAGDAGRAAELARRAGAARAPGLPEHLKAEADRLASQA
ncbi:tetratricopeptide repeat protein [Planomonospora corallina]|uniref:Tetratricopeptide repeat protein n=1 Tax=Planomonospora corallina TaxID=1806052 RepID=A0ABV8IEV9_9ACTN